MIHYNLITRFHRSKDCGRLVDKQKQRLNEQGMKETLYWKSMVTVIMTIHMETNTKTAIIENERRARIKRLKILAQVYANAVEAGAKRKCWRRRERGVEKQGVVCRVTWEAVLLSEESWGESNWACLGDTAHLIQLPGRESEISTQSRKKEQTTCSWYTLPSLPTTHSHTGFSSGTPHWAGGLCSDQ